MITKTIEEVGDSLFCNELEDLVKKNPFMAFVIMSAILEFIAKCNKKPVDFFSSGHSQIDCYEAINNINALNKYSIFNKTTKDSKGKDKNNNDLYEKLRCGMLHSFFPKGGIILSSSTNDLSKKIVGAHEFYCDLQKAWNEIKNDSDTRSYITSESILGIDGVLSSHTSTNKTVSSSSIV